MYGFVWTDEPFPSLYSLWLWDAFGGSFNCWHWRLVSSLPTLSHKEADKSDDPMTGIMDTFVIQAGRVGVTILVSSPRVVVPCGWNLGSWGGPAGNLVWWARRFLGELTWSLFNKFPMIFPWFPDTQPRLSCSCKLVCHSTTSLGSCTHGIWHPAWRSEGVNKFILQSSFACSYCGFWYWISCCFGSLLYCASIASKGGDDGAWDFLRGILRGFVMEAETNLWGSPSQGSRTILVLRCFFLSKGRSTCEGIRVNNNKLPVFEKFIKVQWMAWLRWWTDRSRQMPLQWLFEVWYPLFICKYDWNLSFMTGFSWKAF